MSVSQLCEARRLLRHKFLLMRDYTTERRHTPLGYKPPASEVFILPSPRRRLRGGHGGSSLDRLRFALSSLAGIRRTGPGSDARIPQFGVFDKAEPSRWAPPERAGWRTTLELRRPLLAPSCRARMRLSRRQFGVQRTRSNEALATQVYPCRPLPPAEKGGGAGVRLRMRSAVAARAASIPIEVLSAENDE